jgi:GT2 family glycosyltransferase/predicted SAM-dependent methyltransferase
MHDCRSGFLRYLSGAGLEIGAYDNPLSLPSGASAVYADCLSPEVLKKICPDAKLPDFVGDAEALSEIPDKRFDFIIANHVLEHTTDPIAALLEWHRLLRDNGVLFLALPDKRFTFDRPRERTPLKHLISDHKSDQPARYRNFEHLKEWATHVEGLAEGSAEWAEWVNSQFQNGYNIHNHVWILEDVLQLISYLRLKIGVCYDLLDYSQTSDGDMEFILVLGAVKREQKRFCRVASDFRFICKIGTAYAKCGAKKSTLVRPIIRWRRRLINKANLQRRKIRQYALWLSQKREPVRGAPLFLPHDQSRIEDCFVYMNKKAECEDAARESIRTSLIAQSKQFFPTFLEIIRSDRAFGHFTCELSPIRNVERRGASSYCATGTQPQFSLGTPCGIFPSKLCLIKFEWQGSFPCEPRLYYYVDGRLGEAWSDRLCGVQDGISQTLVELPENISGMRFDPVGERGVFSISSFSIQELRFLPTKEILAVADKLSVVNQEYHETLKIFYRRQIAGLSYKDWLERTEGNDETEREIVKEKSHRLRIRPLISVIMPVYKPNMRLLDLAIRSLKEQVYPNWELCIAEDKSDCQELTSLLRKLEEEDPRIRVVYREKNGNIAEATNSAISLSRGEWLAFLDQDDTLHERALFFIAEEINRRPECQLIYTDEDKITCDSHISRPDGTRASGEGLRYDPHFKSDWNPLLLLSQNYICHLLCVRRSRCLKIGRFRRGFDGVQDWDFIFRYTEGLNREEIRHIPRVLYHWRAIPGSTASSSGAKPHLIEKGLSLVEETLRRRGIQGRAWFDRELRSPRLECTVLGKPKVSIIIPTRDAAAVLRCCIDSIRAKTDYGNFFIRVLDNSSTEPGTFEYFEELEKNEIAEVVKCPGEFNFSRISNIGSRNLDCDVLVFLNNDVEVAEPNWLSEMVGISQLPNVAVVGAKLKYPDGRLQHAGVVLGVGGVANHAFYREQGSTRGYKDRAILLQNYSAVTGACMLVRRTVFEEVGGFNETDLPVAFSDVDLCLRIGELGYDVVWTPHAQLIHHESLSRGAHDKSETDRQVFERHVQYMTKRWGKLLESDPYYNPNLSLLNANFEPTFPPRIARY